MRIISGTAKGRSLRAVPGMSTRPTTDKVKEALFSMIGPYFDGGMVLDLFAGTGGLGIEALSRGMERAIFIDIERKSLDVIHDNLRTTRLADQAEVYRNDAFRALHLLAKRQLKFDLVFLDPPYRLVIMDKLMRALADYKLLSDGAMVVVEQDAAFTGVDHELFVCQRRAEYGDTVIMLYAYKGNLINAGDENDEENNTTRDNSGMPGQL